jgi:hypothetical protein
MSLESNVTNAVDDAESMDLCHIPDVFIKKETEQLMRWGICSANEVDAEILERWTFICNHSNKTISQSELQKEAQRRWKHIEDSLSNPNDIRLNNSEVTKELTEGLVLVYKTHTQHVFRA